MHGSHWLNCLLIGFCALIAASPQAISQLSYSDAVFSDASWNLTTFVFDAGSGSAAASQLVTGGNPAQNRQVNTVTTIVTNNAPSGTFASNVLNGATFDPFLFKSDVTLDFSIDYTHLATNSTGGGGGGGHAIRFLVVQNGRHYVTSLLQGTGQSSTWSTHSLSGLDAADFIEVDSSAASGLNTSSHPDFSTSAAPVLLGFNVASSTGAASAGFTEDVTTAYDNFSVQVNGSSLSTQPSSTAWLGITAELPDFVDFTLNNTASPEVPTTDGDSMLISTDVAGETMTYAMSAAQLAFPSNTVIDFSMKMVSSSAIFAHRRGANVGVAVDDNVLINLWIGIDEIFFTNGADVVVDSNTSIDTDDGYHLYRLEIDGTTAGSPVRLYQDNSLVLQSTLTLASLPGLMSPPRIVFGEGTSAEAGTSEWASFAHNAYRAPIISRTTLTRHHGATDPTTEGYANTDAGLLVDEGPIINDNGTGFDAWYVDDNSVLGGSAILYRSEEFDFYTLRMAETYGWSLITRCRIVEGSTGVFRGTNVSIHTTSRGYAMLFDRESDGDPSVVLNTGLNVGPEIIIEGAGDQNYVYYELRFDPVTQSATLYANGVKYYEGYTGFPSTQPKRINWGGNASNGTGRGHYNLVEWTINTSPTLGISQSGSELKINYIGILQESTDLGATDPWTDVDPQPEPPWTFTPGSGHQFYRLINFGP